jgi:hypothetical protein
MQTGADHKTPFFFRHPISVGSVMNTSVILPAMLTAELLQTGRIYQK